MPAGPRLSDTDAAATSAARTAVEALSDAAADVIGASDSETVLRRISRLALRFVGARGACVHLFGDAKGRPVSVPVSVRAGSVPVSPADREQHVETVHARLHGRVQAVSRSQGSHVVAPLTTAHGILLGGMCLWSPAASSEPVGDALFAQLLRLAGVALEKATQLEHEQWLVRELQRSLLPEVLPAVPAAQVCARYRPASGGEIGGDWYDVFPLAAGRFALVLGDVAGHGVRAASVMGQVRMALRAYALDTEDPADVVRRLNGLMVHLHTSEFTTLILCVWDPATRVAEVVRAGHLPLLLIDSGGASLVETSGSLPIGVDGLAPYVKERLVLDEGSALLLYSDGLVERRGESLDVGLERLVRAAGDYDANLDELCDHLLDRLTGPGTEDDVALLGLGLEENGPDQVEGGTTRTRPPGGSPGAGRPRAVG
ncbi:MAG TPA: PP2C family protein-serine/threonine phosphatase [Actinopolymorphaceae bacterium]